MRFLIFILIVILSIQDVSALRCYECESYNIQRASPIILATDFTTIFTRDYSCEVGGSTVPRTTCPNYALYYTACGRWSYRWISVKPGYEFEAQVTRRGCIDITHTNTCIYDETVFIDIDEEEEALSSFFGTSFTNQLRYDGSLCSCGNDLCNTVNQVQQGSAQPKVSSDKVVSLSSIVAAMFLLLLDYY